MQSKTYRVIVIGPTGAGKSQFCNFAQKDLTNEINEVSDSMNSCTQDPFSNKFERNGLNLELIDTAGSSDSSNNDEINLQKLVNYLRDKKEIDYILLLLKFGERLTNVTKNYLENLGKIFTPNEFYHHLCVIFTKFPVEKPKKKDKETKDKFKKEINETLKMSFKLSKEEIPDVGVYFIDTDIEEDDDGNKSFIQKSQDTVDAIINRIKINYMENKSINTANLDFTGDGVQKRMDEEKKILLETIRRLEEEKEREKKRQIEKEENERKRRIEQEEIERLRRKKEEANKKKLEELIKKQQEENRRLEEERKKEEEERKRAEAERKKYEEEKRKIEEEKKKAEEEERRKGIERDRLEKKEICEKFTYGGLFGNIGSLLLGVGGVILTPFCPAAGPMMIYASLGTSTLSSASTIGGIIGENYYK